MDKNIVLRKSISIALTTFNGAGFLEEQLQSLVEQTVLPDELVVCDDGSSDETISILRDFGGGSPFPVRINVSDLGSVDGWNLSCSIVS